MPWARIIVAVIITALVTLALGLGITMVVSPQTVRSLTAGLSAPGLNEADTAALQSPYLALASGDEQKVVSGFVDVDPATARSAVQQMRALLPATSAKSSSLISWNVFVGTDVRRLSGIHEYEYADRFVRAETALIMTPDGWRIEGFHVRALPRAQAMANKAVSLSGKSPGYVAFVLGAMALPVFMLATALSALFLPNQRHRWLWFIGSLVGVTTFRLNAATGAYAFQPLSFQLLGASALSDGSAFSPWIFGLSIPAFAIAFWIVRAIAPKPAPTVG